MTGPTPPRLPPPRSDGRPYRIGMICLGNICRSPTAEVVVRKTLADAGLADRVAVDSGGTGDWQVGNPIHPIARSALSAAGYDCSTHRARQVAADWFDDHDVLLAMDSVNFADLHRLAGAADVADRLLMFRAFDPESTAGDVDVPDPYGGDEHDYAEVLAMVERTAKSLVEAVALALDSDLDGTLA